MRTGNWGHEHRAQMQTAVPHGERGSATLTRTKIRMKIAPYGQGSRQDRVSTQRPAVPGLDPKQKASPV